MALDSDFRIWYRTSLAPQWSLGSRYLVEEKIWLDLIIVSNLLILLHILWKRKFLCLGQDYLLGIVILKIPPTQKKEPILNPI